MLSCMFLQQELQFNQIGRCVAWLGITLIVFSPSGFAADSVSPPSNEFVHALIRKSCIDCHNDETTEGGLNLKRLDWQLEDPQIRRRWIQIHDRTAAGEMPPEASDLPPTERKALVNQLSKAILDADIQEVREAGRGPMRRLTRHEFEQNLRDLLKLPYLDIKDMLPADREQHHCNKVAEVLDISRIQMEAYLNATEAGLRQAVASGLNPRKPEHHRLPATRMFLTAQTFGEREAMFYAKHSQMVPLTGADLARIRKDNQHDPEMELAIFRSASWPYYGYPDVFKAVEPGTYRLRFSARAVRQLPDFSLRPARNSIPMNFRARKRSGADVSGDVRATRDILDIQPQVDEYETTIRLKKNETFEYSLLGLPVPRAINPPNAPLYYDFPPMPEGGHPGIAFQWLEVTGPIDSAKWPPPSHKQLFDDLPIRKASQGSLAVELVSTHPKQDAVRLLNRFIHLAQRQPTPADVIKIYERLVLSELNQGAPLAEALLTGYSAFLCSGPYLYLPEPQSDSLYRQYAVASRLSHFLGNTRPDSELMAHAANGELLDPGILQKETNRLLQSEANENFITNFTDYWLSLKEIRRDEPDARLYPEYRFDDYLIESMAAETRTFFKDMIHNNRPVTAFVNADYAFINDRLARHYDLEPVSGSRLRLVSLPASSPYGGLLTQAAMMKVTANGTTTSPVLRGAWIMERIMGDPPPPPPTSVPAVEPDIRGATTIREQLARHTKDPVCAACHARFDPVGFALENFDIMGARRQRYRSLGRGEKITGIDRAGHAFAYHVAGAIDASGQLRDGRKFRDIQELKQILMADPRQLARNLIHQFTVYTTGVPVRFSDRPAIEAILDQCSANGYRTRDLLQALVQSRIFLGSDPGSQVTQNSE
ncbi:DUF1592 domain-containing protein [Gimesia fumaroli]|uniref:Planctomycete cytochrome C n=1 Tax=Gimesia fumaroli TaxID=2527976 RepID=A0A518IGL2_9PLAN|nr:DUF1592 domain-containing protein [Gimesia fumaroli]QDV52228.1 hypothetical protein Enr17x_42880 [Gimesia fumaroli]